MTRAWAVLVCLALSACVSGGDALERGWGQALGVLPGEDGSAWGVYAQSELAASAGIAMVEFDDGDVSGRTIQGGNDEVGVTTVQIDTPEGPWSAAVDADGNLVWADPLPEDPTVLAGAIGDAGIAAEDLADQCETCTSGIGPLVIVVVIAVVAVAGIALWTAWRDPPNRGEAKPGPSQAPSPTPSSGGTAERRNPRTNPGAVRPVPSADCGPEPTGDIRKDPVARRRHFAYLQCLARAGAGH